MWMFELQNSIWWMKMDGTIPFLKIVTPSTIQEQQRGSSSFLLLLEWSFLVDPLASHYHDSYQFVKTNLLNCNYNTFLHQNILLHIKFYLYSESTHPLDFWPFIESLFQTFSSSSLEFYVEYSFISSTKKTLISEN